MDHEPSMLPKGGTTASTWDIASLSASLPALAAKVPIRSIEPVHLTGCRKATQAATGDVDSMHACIERASKAVEVYLPRDWALIAATARKTGKPYCVTRMTNQDIFDFKAIASKLIANRKKADNGVCLNWMKIKWLRFVKGSELVQIKMDLDDSPFVTLNVRNNTRGRAVKPESVKSLLKPLYTAPIAISKAKFCDLQDLCKTLVIPTDCHYFYKSLVHSESVADKLEEPDLEEGSDDGESFY